MRLTKCRPAPPFGALLGLFFLLVAGLMAGCAFGPPLPPAEAQRAGLSWVGAEEAELRAGLGPPAGEKELGEGRKELRWRRERSVTGPPRHEFGPGGRIKTRPGRVDYYYCDTLAVIDSQGRVTGLEVVGHCPPGLQPPARGR